MALSNLGLKLLLSSKFFYLLYLLLLLFINRLKFLVMPKKYKEILKIQYLQQNVALILRAHIEVMTQTTIASTKIKKLTQLPVSFLVYNLFSIHFVLTTSKNLNKLKNRISS